MMDDGRRFAGITEQTHYADECDHATGCDECTITVQSDEDVNLNPQDVAAWLRQWANDLTGIKTNRARMLEHAARAAEWAINDEFGF